MVWIVASLKSALVVLNVISDSSAAFERLLMLRGGGGGAGGLGDRGSSSRGPHGEGGFICRLLGGGVFGGTDLSLAFAMLASH